MEIYSDMTISGSQSDLSELLQRLDGSSLAGSWRRDETAERDIAPLLLGQTGVRCFENTTETELPSACLWLDIESDRWEVTNVIPMPPNDSLTPSQYHSLLCSFRGHASRLATDLRIRISEPLLDVGPGYWLTPKTEKLLHAFSTLANKSTGASHPRDRERWHAFVRAAHEDRVRVGGDELSRILVEHDHWSESKASELAILFEYELALLNDLAKTA